MSSLGADYASEVILTEFVDAVEIRNKRRELDIKRLIETYPKDAVRLSSGSDCHDWAAYPGTEGGEISFSSLKCLPTFEGLLMAITDLSRIKVGDCSFFSTSSSKLGLAGALDRWQGLRHTAFAWNQCDHRRQLHRQVDDDSSIDRLPACGRTAAV